MGIPVVADAVVLGTSVVSGSSVVVVGATK